jgi:enoyl-CoA hydratase/carnithine racemase
MRRCAGADLSTSNPVAAMSPTSTGAWSIRNPGVAEMPACIARALHGHAVGVGCSNALAADIRIATPKPVRPGVHQNRPDSRWRQRHFLPRMIGYPKAFSG